MIVAKNESNKNTDWWFIYKTPIHTGSESNEGFQYLYYDSENPSLELSSNQLDQDHGALHHTLKMVFETSDPDHGFLVYNDERTDGGDNDGSKGHTKGILVFNKTEDTGLYLLHSTPRFPALNETSLPDDEKIYGQTFLCLTLENYDSVEKIAAQMLKQQNPQVLVKNSKLPASIEDNEAIYQLYHQSDIEESKTPSTLKLKTKAGKDFRLIAKSKEWGKDFWIDLVGPELDVDLNVESWRRGDTVESSEPGQDEDVLDVEFINLTPIGLKEFNWKYTKDHSKWATVDKKDIEKGPWVCVADINRMSSQEDRGGGSLCFQEKNLWKQLNSIEAKRDFEKTSS